MTITAMITAFITSLALQTFGRLDSAKPVDFAWIMIITVSITTVVWLAVTFATPPESKDTLVKFYQRARPGIAGWRPVARMAPEVKADNAGAHNLVDWICGCVLIYGVLFGTGKLLLGETGTGLALLALGFAGGAVIYFDLSRRGWNAVTG